MHTNKSFHRSRVKLQTDTCAAVQPLQTQKLDGNQPEHQREPEPTSGRFGGLLSGRERVAATTGADGGRPRGEHAGHVPEADAPHLGPAPAPG